MYYATCLCCGYRLLRAENGTKIELVCPKCKQKLSVIVKDHVIIIGKFSIKDTIEI